MDHFLTLAHVQARWYADYHTQRRNIESSGYSYSEVARNNGIQIN